MTGQELITCVKDAAKIESCAVLSECQNYRYLLTRIWDTSKPLVMFIMLNPSIADGLDNDPTIRRCINFAKSWGFGGILVCNLFGLRSTQPQKILEVNDPEGVYNSRIMFITQLMTKMVICAWGNEKIIKRKFGKVDASDWITIPYEKQYHLKVSKTNIPSHPLYLKSDLLPKLHKIKKGMFTNLILYVFFGVWCAFTEDKRLKSRLEKFHIIAGFNFINDLKGMAGLSKTTINTEIELPSKVKDILKQTPTIS